MDTRAPGMRRWTRWVRPALLVALVGAGIVLFAMGELPRLDDVRAWVVDAGWAGPVVFALLFATLSLTPTPASLLTVAAGVLFGLSLGIATVLAGALVGASAGFAAGRVLGRGTVLRFAGARMARLDQFLQRRGVLAVAATRLVPLVPFTTLNLACGLTALRFREYLLGTALGILPSVVAFVTIGAYGSDPGSAPFLVAVGGIVVLAVGAAVAARRRHRAAADDS
ncbi:MAG: TVP38/TMEM64 family protein [Pseudonocardia sp.]